MRGLKPRRKPYRSKIDTVASFTDAWIETICSTVDMLCQTVASFTDAWIETKGQEALDFIKKSHLLQMRGLKLNL